MTIIFNHIPKTGGITLRGILNKIYQQENVFFIDSRNIAASIQNLKNMSASDRSKLKVIAGHGADFISEYFENPFRIIILREPISLFISQYKFLKSDPGTIFLDDVSALENIEDYLDYAIQNGQDNLLTRYVSDSMSSLIEPEIQIPNMEKDGDFLLEKAKQGLKKYDAVLNLYNFDRGVFALSQKLGWNRIPIYRPQNQNKTHKKKTNLISEFESRLRHALRFDIELYDWFLNSDLDISNHVDASQFTFKLFILRQNTLNFMSRFIAH